MVNRGVDGQGIAAASLAGQVFAYRGVQYTVSDGDDLADLLADGTGLLLVRNRRGDQVVMAVVVREGQIVRAASRRGPWADVQVVVQ